MTWWRRLWRRGRLERELDAELRFHLDRLVDDYIRAGAAPEEARRSARLEFGGIEQLKEDCRDARATRWAHDLTADLRFAARLLRKDRAFTALAVIALALGTGVNSTFFAIVNAICLRGPLENPARLVYVDSRDSAGMPGGISYADFLDVRSSVPSLSPVAAYAAAPAAVSDDHLAAERVTAAYVTPDALDVAGGTPLEGRLFDRDDDRAGAPAVAIVGAALWERRYGAGEGIGGRSVRINGRPTPVIGIMREAFRFPNDAEIWLPLAALPGVGAETRNARLLAVFGRLTGGSAIADVQAELGALAGRLERDHPRTNVGIRMLATPFNERFTPRITDPAWLAFITAGTLVLLIACANVANLLLARAVRRSSEIAIRASLGAGRGRIVRQLLVECVLLALAGGAVGLLFSFLGIRLLSSAIPADALPSWMALTMDGRVFGMLAAICLATVFAFGLVPALHASNASVTHVVRDRRHGGATGASARRWTTGFVALQFALTFVLLAAVAGSILFRETDDPVIDTTDVLTTWIAPPPQTYKTAEERARFYELALQEAAGIAGVSPTIASVLPFAAAPQRRVAASGRESSRADAASSVGTVAIGPGYFETLGVGVIKGRDFTQADARGGAGVAIVNQRFADVYFPNQDPLRQRIRLPAQNESAETAPALAIVGVSPNVPQGRSTRAAPVAYLPFAGPPPSAALILRHAPGDTAVAAALRERVRLLDPDVPLYRTASMERAVSDAGWNPRVSSALINTISTIALILAVVGLYGVTAHSVAARAREIGIRIALGARPRHVRWLVLRRALVQLAIGVPAGAAFTVAWNRLFIVQAADSRGTLTVVGATALLIVVVGLAACLLPARRAVRVDPVGVIRDE